MCTVFIRCDAGAMEIHAHCLSHYLFYLLCLDCGLSIADIDGCNWHCALGAISVQVLDTTTCCSDRTSQAGATEAMYNFLIAYSIVLRCERIGDRRGTVYFSVGAQHFVQVLDPNVQVHILQPEWRVIACCSRILSWPEEEEKGNGDRFDNVLGVLMAHNTVCLCK
jgi:hypothetical protein